MKCVIQSIGVRCSPHPTHNTPNIVANSISVLVEWSRAGHCGLEGGVVDSGEVTGSGRLVFGWSNSERIDVDTNGWTSWQVLERLGQVEVTGWTGSETVVTVELEFHGNKRIGTGVWSRTVGEIGPSVGITTSLGNGLDVVGQLHSSDQHLDWVVEVETLLHVGLGE